MLAEPLSEATKVPEGFSEAYGCSFIGIQGEPMGQTGRVRLFGSDPGPGRIR
jgi:hypothetical protein